MAYVANTQNVHLGLFGRVTDMFRAASERMAQYRTFRTTVNELEALDARELADLGLHRSMIVSIAREAAYGEQ